jgi:transcriptional regulator with XRE-family HTH domain
MVRRAQAAIIRGMPAPIAASKTAASPLGALLRQWRARRRLSQLELSLLSGISARHLSYVETGRAQPSRQMVHSLADALEAPLRERNALLVAAGYAPQFRESPLDAPDLAVMRRAIEVTLAHQEPFPAFVTDRCWNVLMANDAMGRVLDGLKPGGPTHGNIVRQVFDPDDMRPFIENWDEVAGDLLRHLSHQVGQHPGDDEARALLDEALSYPDVPARLRVRDAAVRPLPVLVTTFRAGARRLSFFSTLTRFASPADVALEETTVECMHPADDETRRYCIELAG